MARHSGPDDLLAAENASALNRTFYASSPVDYFERRLTNLMLVAGRRDQLDELLRGGVLVGGLRYQTRTSSDPGNADESVGDSKDGRDRSAQHFVTAEAEVLSHHLGETLLRLYFAHASTSTEPPPCPWLELSRLRDPTKFRSLVMARFGQVRDELPQSDLEAVARVFCFTADRTAMSTSPPSKEHWQQLLATIDGYLTAYAAEFLSRGPMYNAAKHGLALVPSEMSIEFANVIKQSGPVIQYLEVKKGADGSPRWRRSTHWVMADWLMALTALGCELLNTLWAVARFRYLAPPGASLKMPAFNAIPYHRLLMAAGQGENGFHLTDMSWELVYWKAADGKESAERP